LLWALKHWSVSSDRNRSAAYTSASEMNKFFAISEELVDVRRLKPLN
jgi:hypothetical protein